MKLPKKEKVWVSYNDAQHNLRFILTSKENSREVYYLYELVNDELVKLGKSASPTELENKFKVAEKLKGFSSS